MMVSGRWSGHGRRGGHARHVCLGARTTPNSKMGFGNRHHGAISHRGGHRNGVVRQVHGYRRVPNGSSQHRGERGGIFWGLGVIYTGIVYHEGRQLIRFLGLKRGRRGGSQGTRYGIQWGRYPRSRPSTSRGQSSHHGRGRGTNASSSIQ